MPEIRSTWPTPAGQKLSEFYGEFLAIDAAMDKLQDGDLCLILVDQVEEAMAHIAARGQQLGLHPA